MRRSRTRESGARCGKSRSATKNFCGSARSLMQVIWHWPSVNLPLQEMWRRQRHAGARQTNEHDERSHEKDVKVARVAHVAEVRDWRWRERWWKARRRRQGRRGRQQRRRQHGCETDERRHRVERRSGRSRLALETALFLSLFSQRMLPNQGPCQPSAASDTHSAARPSSSATCLGSESRASHSVARARTYCTARRLPRVPTWLAYRRSSASSDRASSPPCRAPRPPTVARRAACAASNLLQSPSHGRTCTKPDECRSDCLAAPLASRRQCAPATADLLLCLTAQKVARVAQLAKGEASAVQGRESVSRSMSCCAGPLSRVEDGVAASAAAGAAASPCRSTPGNRARMASANASMRAVGKATTTSGVVDDADMTTMPIHRHRSLKGGVDLGVGAGRREHALRWLRQPHVEAGKMTRCRPLERKCRMTCHRSIMSIDHNAR